MTKCRIWWDGWGANYLWSSNNIVMEKFASTYDGFCWKNMHLWWLSQFWNIFGYQITPKISCPIKIWNFVNKYFNFFKGIIGQLMPNLGGDLGAQIGSQITPKISHPVNIWNFVNKKFQFFEGIICQLMPNLGGDWGAPIGSQITPQISRPVQIWNFVNKKINININIFKLPHMLNSVH